MFYNHACVSTTVFAATPATFTPNGNQSAYCATCMSLRNNTTALFAHYGSQPRPVKQSKCTVTGCNAEAAVAGFCSSCQWCCC